MPGILPDLTKLFRFPAHPMLCPLPVFLVTDYLYRSLAKSPPQARNRPVSIVYDLTIERIPQSPRDLSSYQCIKNPMQNTIAI